MARIKAEREVQTEIIKYAKDNGWYVIKVIKGNSDGIHDLVLCINGYFVSCEVKAEKFIKDPFKQASEWQKRHWKLVRQSGGISMVVASLEQFKSHLQASKDYIFGRVIESNDSCDFLD